MSKPVRKRQIPEANIAGLFLGLLLIGIAVIALSRWIRDEFGRIELGGTNGRPVIVDAAVLGVGIAIAVVAAMGLIMSVYIGRLFAKAISFAQPRGIAFPAERISRHVTPTQRGATEVSERPVELPYYFAVSMSASQVRLWDVDDQPLVAFGFEQVASLRISREKAPSLRRVLTISFASGEPDLSVSVMSQSLLVLPETSSARLDEIVSVVNRTGPSRS